MSSHPPPTGGYGIRALHPPIGGFMNSFILYSQWFINTIRLTMLFGLTMLIGIVSSLFSVLLAPLAEFHPGVDECIEKYEDWLYSILEKQLHNRDEDNLTAILDSAKE